MTNRPGVTGDVDRQWYIAAIGVLVALALVLAAQTWSRAMRADGNDFTSYLLASRALWHGANPYITDTPFPFIYPLFLCVVVWPLTQMPYGLAVGLWYALAVAALSVALAWTASLHGHSINEGQRRRWVVAAAIVCVLLTDVVQNNLVNGQVNAVVLALCLLFACLFARGRGATASMALAAAIAVKITPAILLVFLIRRRAWREAALTIATTAIFVLAVPWMVARSTVIADYQYYAQTFLTDRLADATTVVGHSRAFGVVEVLRQLTGASWAADALVCAAVLSIALLLFDRSAPDHPRPAAMMLSLYLAAALLISPMSEVHHLIFLLPGLTLLVWRALAGLSSGPATAGVAAVLLALVAIRFVPFAAFAAVVGTCALLVAAIRKN